MANPVGKIFHGHFEADGADINLDLGFVPNYFRIINFMAADTEVAMIEWWKEMGDGVAIHWINSDTGEQNFLPKSSGGLIAEYNTAAFSEVSSTVSATGFQGVTILAAFMDNSDECYFEAHGTDREKDFGDINA